MQTSENPGSILAAICATNREVTYLAVQTAALKITPTLTPRLVSVMVYLRNSPVAAHGDLGSPAQDIERRVASHMSKVETIDGVTLLGSRDAKTSLGIGSEFVRIKSCHDELDQLSISFTNLMGLVYPAIAQLGIKGWSLRFYTVADFESSTNVLDFLRAKGIGWNTLPNLQLEAVGLKLYVSRSNIGYEIDLGPDAQASPMPKNRLLTALMAKRETLGGPEEFTSCYAEDLRVLREDVYPNLPSILA